MGYERTKKILRRVDSRIIGYLAPKEVSADLQPGKGSGIDTSGTLNEVVKSIKDYDNRVLGSISYSEAHIKNSKLLQVYTQTRSSVKKVVKKSLRTIRAKRS